MATFDGARFVDEQLSSIANQTRRPDELVVCDDASRDDTAERVERFAASAPFEVRLERNSTRLTSSPNFEKAVSMATGDLIFLADQDDVWFPQKVETLSDVLEENPTVGAVFSNARIADADLRPLQMNLWKALFFTPREREQVRRGSAVEVFLKHVVAAGTTMAFRGSYRDLVLPLPPLRDCHDAWIAFLIAAVADFHILDRDLVTYRIHGKNQFGLHELTLREQFAEARKQVDVGAFRYAIDFFSAARERLVAQCDPRLGVGVRTLELIDEKIGHCMVREEMSPRLLRRIPRILGEALHGRYSRYSYGIKSIAQDVFLR